MESFEQQAKDLKKMGEILRTLKSAIAAIARRNIKARKAFSIPSLFKSPYGCDCR